MLPYFGNSSHDCADSRLPEKSDIPFSPWARTLLKLRTLFLPILASGSLFLLVYSLLNWFLVAENGLLPLDGEVANFWLPMLLVWPTASLSTRGGRYNLRKDERGRITFFYMLAAVVAIAAPTIVAQSYVTAAAGNLTHVKNAAEEVRAPLTKYYSADMTCIDLKHPRGHADAIVSGHNNETLTFKFYALAPVCDARNGSPAIWIGSVFRKSISNRLSDEAKQSEYRAFLQQTEKAFEQTDASKYTFFERISASEDRRGMEKALPQTSNAFLGIILRPHNEPFDKRTGERG